MEFADYYIEEIKHRVYSEEKSQDNEIAKIVLVKINTEILKLLSPFIPHLTEETFQENFKEYGKEKSIHLEKWPEEEAGLINEEAEKAGELAKEIIGEIRKYKSGKNLSMNAEIEKAKIYTENPELLEKIEEDVKATMKVKEIIVEKGPLKVEISQ